MRKEGKIDIVGGIEMLFEELVSFI